MGLEIGEDSRVDGLIEENEMLTSECKHLHDLIWGLFYLLEGKKELTVDNWCKEMAALQPDTNGEVES